MKDEGLNKAMANDSRTITICMDVFGINRQINVDFDYYYSFLEGAYAVIKDQGHEKARLIYNMMLGAISTKALHMSKVESSSALNDEIADFNHDCYITTLLGNLLHVAPAYIKANWDFDAAIAQIDCPCCGEKLCSTSSN